jgi:Methyltransferase domain
VKLNVCCGGRILDGYTNVDVAPAPGAAKPDILADARRIPLADGCASEVMCIHGFEHFYRWQVDPLLDEWKRLLCVGGMLILELPDLLKCCENILSGYTDAGKHQDQAGMWGLYGDPRLQNPLMCHRWGWTPKTLRNVLEAHRFIDIQNQETRFHPAGRVRRDMRIVARKAAP